jgi:hypothetical protein
VSKHESAGSKYMVKLSFSLLYAGFAWLMVYCVPTSAGSGIPETKVRVCLCVRVCACVCACVCNLIEDAP